MGETRQCMVKQKKRIIPKPIRKERKKHEKVQLQSPSLGCQDQVWQSNPRRPHHPIGFAHWYVCTYARGGKRKPTL